MLLGWFEIIFFGFLILMLGAAVGFGIGMWRMHKRCRVDTWEWFKAGMDAERDFQRALFGEETNPHRPF